MDRVKLNMPDRFLYATTLDIRIADINYGGHLSNDAVLALMHEARIRFLQHYGYSELDIGGASLIMADTAIVYKAEGFHGHRLRIGVTPSGFTRSGFDLFYKLTREKESRDIAHAKTGMVCFDYDTHKVAPLPDAFREKLEKASAN